MAKKITTEIEALAAVKKNGDMLKEIPEKLRTEKVCIAALKNDAFLGDVPEALRTEQICLMYLKLPNNNGFNLMGVPKSVMTEEFCITAAEGYISPHVYEVLPETIWKNEKFCRAMLLNSYPLEVLKHIAKELWQKEDFCRFALGELIDKKGSTSFDRNSMNITIQKEVPNYIPKKFWENKDFCRYALGVDVSGYVLRYVPEDLITLKMCQAIIKKEGGTVQYAPQKFKAELYKEQVKLYPDAISDIPQKELTPELCLIAVKADGSTLEYVPGKFKTMELCLSAAQNSRAFEYMPEKLKFKVLAAVIGQVKFDPKGQKAYRNIAEYIRFLPDDMKGKAKELCAKEPPVGEEVTAKKPAVKKPAVKKPAAKQTRAKKGGH